jgi:methylated-DNA-[protein]-cysteine S-methyltransferase
MPEPLHLQLNRLETPIGQMLILTDTEGNLRVIDWLDHEPRMRLLLQHQYRKQGLILQESATPNACTRALESYFAGDLLAIDNLPTKTGGTPFQQKVWKALQQIPCGVTISYTQLAMRIGQSSAVRAVGLANGANPIGVVVPCHRVIGTNGSLTGYGGGLHRKIWLLQHESARPATAQSTLF